MAITISGENNNDRILAQDGVIDQISGINIVGLLTAGHINVGDNIQLGNAGVATATTFIGNLTGNVNATSNLLLQIGGSEKVRINSSGNLGIGNNTPNDKLVVNGAITSLGNNVATYAARLKANYDSTHVLSLESYHNSSTPFEVIGSHADSGGANPRVVIAKGRQKVGIGSVSPAHALDIQGSSSSFTKLSLSNQTMNTSKYEIIFGDQGQVNHVVAANREITFATNGSSNERLRIDNAGTISYRTGGGKGFSFNSSGSSADLANVFCPASYTLAFGTNSNERLRITSDGIIETGTAIGDSAYDGNQRLRVGRTGDCSISIRANGSTTAATGLDFGDDDDDRAGRIQYVHNGNYMSFHTNGAGTGSANEQLRITSGGLVGIGTNSPKLLLHLHQENSNATFAHFTNTTTGVNGNQGVSFGLDSNEDAAIFHYGSNAIRFGTGGTEKARIDSSGRLLVKEQVNASGTYGQYATLQLKGNSLNTNASIMLMANGKNTTANVSGDYLGYIIFGDKQAGEYAFIRGAVDAAPAVGDYPGRIEFHTTADGASGATERLRIDSSGAVSYTHLTLPTICSV